VLVEIDYEDPIAEHEPIERAAAAGPVNGIVVTPRFIQTRESGVSDSFYVSLDKQPTKDVTIPLKIQTTGEKEGTFEAGKATFTKSLVFTPANYRFPQKVTLTGVKDTPTSGTNYTPDKTVSYLIETQAATSEDPLFAGMNGPDVIVSNADRDGNILITPGTLVTTELDDLQNQKSFQIQLQREPKAPVSIVATIENGAEGTIVSGTVDPTDPAKRIFTFLPRDATATPPIQLTQQVNVRGKDDGIRDGNISYNITFTVSSADQEFDGLRLKPVVVTNVGNGVVGTPANP
jgi:hypothetical protein